MTNKTLSEKRWKSCFCENGVDIIKFCYYEEDVKEKIQEFLRDLKHEFNINSEVLMNWELFIDKQAKWKFGDL